MTTISNIEQCNQAFDAIDKILLIIKKRAFNENVVTPIELTIFDQNESSLILESINYLEGILKFLTSVFSTKKDFESMKEKFACMVRSVLDVNEELILGYSKISHNSHDMKELIQSKSFSDNEILTGKLRSRMLDDMLKKVGNLSHKPLYNEKCKCFII